jgi:hypothetical protein
MELTPIVEMASMYANRTTIGVHARQCFYLAVVIISFGFYAINYILHESTLHALFNGVCSVFRFHLQETKV